MFPLLMYGVVAGQGVVNDPLEPRALVAAFGSLRVADYGHVAPEELGGVIVEVPE